MTLSNNLVDKFERVINSSSQERRTDVLRKITDMFISGATSYSDEQLNLFDDILARLTKEIEELGQGRVVTKDLRCQSGYPKIAAPICV